MADDRINRLSERFRRHETTASPPKKRNRGRRSFYVDLALVERIDETYLAVRHALYPLDISKSAFLEALLEYSLVHLDEVTESLSDAAEPAATESTGES